VTEPSVKKCLKAGCTCGEFAPADLNKITCLCSHRAGRHEKTLGNDFVTQVLGTYSNSRVHRIEWFSILYAYSLFSQSFLTETGYLGQIPIPVTWSLAPKSHSTKDCMCKYLIQNIEGWVDFLAAAIIKSYPPPIFQAYTNIKDEYAIQMPIEANILKNMEPFVFFYDRLHSLKT